MNEMPPDPWCVSGETERLILDALAAPLGQLARATKCIPDTDLENVVLVAVRRGSPATQQLGRSMAAEIGLSVERSKSLLDDLADLARRSPGSGFREALAISELRRPELESAALYLAGQRAAEVEDAGRR